MPYAIDLRFKFDGTGVMIAFANKIASGTRYTETTAMATEELPDTLFSIPAGWKTVVKKPVVKKP